MREKLAKTLEELEEEAGRFAGSLAPQAGGATLVTLAGELGAGKTAFTKAAARALGVDEVLTSPTFVLEKIYQLRGSTPKFKRLVHIDAYRLESGKELVTLGFDELMRDSSNLIFLEWPEKVADALPAPATQISLEAFPDGSRVITYG